MVNNIFGFKLFYREIVMTCSVSIVFHDILRELWLEWIHDKYELANLMVSVRSNTILNLRDCVRLA